ncbi:hypothetical protein VNO78_00082 [Psophocarpus tetragonolobus]|uniref:Cytochrome b/b6 C-terminal region profile domain-containing protein n=1 Tax=Psophocarpus tetragonolobus TaxID=3891 RepID=A0AAN9SZZ5_PSOTE
MGYYCYKRKAYSTHTSDVIGMLVVALMLLALPWLFTREQKLVVVKEKKTNWSALITPILVLLILLLLSLFGSRRRLYVKPPCYRCKHVSYCYY